MTALILASRHGHTDIARVLIENGADVNMVDKVRKYFDNK